MAKIIIEENRKKSEIDLSKEIISIGRSTRCDVKLKDSKASRMHCQIQNVPKGYLLIDLNSKNSTSVNGDIVYRHLLKDEDLIEIGNAKITFILEDYETEEDEETREISPPELEQITKERDNLLRIQQTLKAINSELKLEPLLELIVDIVIELTKAERGFIILIDEDGINIEVARNFEKEKVSKPELEVSRSVAVNVSQTGKPILAINAQEDPNLSEFKSVESLGLRSLLCCPLKVKEKTVGTLYIDNRLQKGVFSQGDLELLTIFSEQAAISVENASLYENLLNEQKKLKRSHKEIEKLNKKLNQTVEEQKVEIIEKKRILENRQKEFELQYNYGNIIGRSKKMQKIFSLLDKITNNNQPVLIQGDSGTGKELVARAIHFNGPRKEKPFVSENCAAIPKTLLESELFGYVKGAFTGADKNKDGLFKLAHKGTLFLDEIADMSEDMQKKLLRVLQEWEIRPVGGKKKFKIDLRLITACNENLRELMENGKFRKDLFFRLNVFTVNLPLLRERREDIPLLVDHFLEEQAKGKGKRKKVIQQNVLNLLIAYDWPGNIRELRNEVIRMYALSGDVITENVLSQKIKNGYELSVEEVVPLDSIVSEVEKKEIVKALTTTEGNKTKAAELLKISRFALQRKIEKYDIRF